MNAVSYRMKQQNLVRSKTQGFLKYSSPHPGTTNSPQRERTRNPPCTISPRQYLSSHPDLQLEAERGYQPPQDGFEISALPAAPIRQPRNVEVADGEGTQHEGLPHLQLLRCSLP